MHNDIIQEDFVDSYKNLTVKIIMSFKWVKLYCPQAEYVIRVNHHVVMNTYAMIKFLEIQRDSYFRTNNYFMGTVLEQTLLFGIGVINSSFQSQVSKETPTIRIWKALGIS